MARATSDDSGLVVILKFMGTALPHVLANPRNDKFSFVTEQTMLKFLGFCKISKFERVVFATTHKDQSIPYYRTASMLPQKTKYCDAPR